MLCQAATLTAKSTKPREKGGEGVSERDGEGATRGEVEEKYGGAAGERGGGGGGASCKTLSFSHREPRFHAKLRAWAEILSLILKSEMKHCQM